MRLLNFSCAGILQIVGILDAKSDQVALKTFQTFLFIDLLRMTIITARIENDGMIIVHSFDVVNYI